MRYAGFWRRLAAHIIDSIILNLAAWGVELALFGAMYGVYLVLAHRNGALVKPFSDAFDPFMEQIASVVIYVALAAVYFILGTFRYGTTLGKRPFKVYVVRASDGGPITRGQSALRFVGYAASYLTFGCGFLMAAFHPQKRALHDLIAGTVSVIKEG
jgi:uncharacterized RDD family membrane protein YckC